MKRPLALLIAIVFAFPDSARSADVATVSFSAGKQATFPETIKAGQTIQVDLSALTKDATIYRAICRPGRNEADAAKQRNLPVKITIAGSDDALSLLPPRFNAFDVTDAVRKALQSGRGKVAFQVASFPGYQPAGTRLDVTANIKAKNAIPAVKDLRVWHRSGQTFLTWAEVDPPTTEQVVTFKEWNLLRTKLTAEPRMVRYRIYRSNEPITAETIGKAELIDEVGPLTAWNPDYYGISPRDSDTVPRYVVEDDKAPVSPGTGVYVHNPAKAGKGHYAVSLVVDGAEDLSALSTTRDAVVETAGAGVPVLQRIVKPKDFNYVSDPTLHYYVRWEALPRCNMPSRPYDYLVAVPANHKEPAPVGLHLHCWGANPNGGYGWWYNVSQGAILISTNQIPYDWLTGYHEHLGTWKSWSEGVIRDYTQQRVLAFDWAGQGRQAAIQTCLDTEFTFARLRTGEHGALAVAALAPDEDVRAARLLECLPEVARLGPADGAVVLSPAPGGTTCSARVLLMASAACFVRNAWRAFMS